jgi:glycerol-3-phosphate dehydrogenase (NAD(P)+)
MKFGVIGSGSWGTALVKILQDNGQEVVWCVRSQKMVDHIQARHHNPKYLSSIYFSPQNLNVTTDPLLVYEQADAVVLAIPSAYATAYLDNFSAVILERKTKIISAVKGILPEVNMLLNEYLSGWEGFQQENYFTIMGPCHAEEVAAEKLSYLTFAGLDRAETTSIAAAFKTPYVNTVVSRDVAGVQYAAVLKNIYALGTGIAHGLGYGDNFQSVLVANAAGEMKRFLNAIREGMGQSIDHAASVYLGDLLVTCYSLFSRNRSFGNMIGKGYSVEAAKLAMQMVAEGLPAAKCIHEINISAGADMPIANTIYEVLWKGVDTVAAFEKLEASLS